MENTYRHYVPNERPKRNGLKYLAELALVGGIIVGAIYGFCRYNSHCAEKEVKDKRNSEMVVMDEWNKSEGELIRQGKVKFE